MYIKDRLIDTVPVSFKKIATPGYLEGLKIELEEKHAAVINSSGEQPVFFVEHVPSSMNPKKK